MWQEKYNLRVNSSPNTLSLRKSGLHQMSRIWENEYRKNIFIMINVSHSAKAYAGDVCALLIRIYLILVTLRMLNCTLSLWCLPLILKVFPLHVRVVIQCITKTSTESRRVTNIVRREVSPSDGTGSYSVYYYMVSPFTVKLT